MSCRIGQALVRDGFSGSHVGLFMENQVEFFPTMYGTHAAGGIAVPFNARTRGLHLHHVVTKSDVSVIVVRDEYFEHLQKLNDIGVVETVVVVGEPPEVETLHGAAVVGFDQWIADLPPRRREICPTGTITPLFSSLPGLPASPKESSTHTTSSISLRLCSLILSNRLRTRSCLPLCPSITLAPCTLWEIFPCMPAVPHI
ncbi:hypothetical protein CM1200mP19_0010 [bacterium]|nr:MAG: hypothetical protein CM1200mP19_0010 [bacterium]